MSVEECFIVAVAAMEEAPFGDLPGSAWEWSLARVDAKAWREICDAREEFDRRAQAAVEASRERGPEKDTRDVVVGAATFPAEDLRRVE